MFKIIACRFAKQLMFISHSTNFLNTLTRGPLIGWSLFLFVSDKLYILNYIPNSTVKH